MFFPLFRTIWDSCEFLSKSVGSRKISQFRQKKSIISNGEALEPKEKKYNTYTYNVDILYIMKCITLHEDI